MGLSKPIEVEQAKPAWQARYPGASAVESRVSAGAAVGERFEETLLRVPEAARPLVVWRERQVEGAGGQWDLPVSPGHAAGDAGPEDGIGGMRVGRREHAAPSPPRSTPMTGSSTERRGFEV